MASKSRKQNDDKRDSFVGIGDSDFRISRLVKLMAEAIERGDHEAYNHYDQEHRTLCITRNAEEVKEKSRRPSKEDFAYLEGYDRKYLNKLSARIRRYLVDWQRELKKLNKELNKFDARRVKLEDNIRRYTSKQMAISAFLERGNAADSIGREQAVLQSDGTGGELQPLPLICTVSWETPSSTSPRRKRKTKQVSNPRRVAR